MDYYILKNDEEDGYWWNIDIPCLLRRNIGLGKWFQRDLKFQTRGPQLTRISVMSYTGRESEYLHSKLDLPFSATVPILSCTCILWFRAVKADGRENAWGGILHSALGFGTKIRWPSFFTFHDSFLVATTLCWTGSSDEGLWLRIGHRSIELKNTWSVGAHNTKVHKVTPIQKTSLLSRLSS